MDPVQPMESGQHYPGKSSNEDDSCTGGCGRDSGQVTNLSVVAIPGHQPCSSPVTGLSLATTFVLLFSSLP